MAKLLYIKASPRTGRSHSVSVADEFISEYKKLHPDDHVAELDIFSESLPSFDGMAVQAKYNILHGREHSTQETQAWEAIEKVISNFKSADKYVLAVPMWNFSIPYRLKQYIDIIVQPGYTFTYSQEKGYQGLVQNKPLLAIYARGGEYSSQESQAIEMQKKYIDWIFSFIGFTDIRSIIIEPTLQGGPDTTAAKKANAALKAKEIAVIF